MNRIDLNGIVTGLSVDGLYIDCIIKDSLCKINKNTKEIVLSKKVFSKEGFTRDMIGDEGRLIVRDFYSLYVFNRSDYKEQMHLELGTDLKNDICGMVLESGVVYAFIRNGAIKRVDIKSQSIDKINTYDSGSIWNAKIVGDTLIGGNVDGELVFIDKNSLEIISVNKISKQNIGSVFVDDEYVYAAGQDKAIYKVHLESNQIILKKRKAHNRMFDCVGMIDSMLVTICHPMNEVCFWNKVTLEMVLRIELDLKLSGRTAIDDERILISSRSIDGLYEVDLEGTVHNCV